MLTLFLVFGGLVTFILGNVFDDAEMRGFVIYFIVLIYPAFKQDWSNYVNKRNNF